MAQALVPPLATPRPAVRAPLGYRGSRRDTVTRAATRHDLIGARDDDDDARCPSTDSPTVDRRALLLGAAASCASMSPLASYADTFADTEDIAKNYDRYASYYDDLDGGAFASETLGLEKSRRDLLARASGDVLELGVVLLLAGQFHFILVYKSAVVFGHGLDLVFVDADLLLQRPKTLFFLM